MEIQSCESVANAPCKSHANSSAVLAICPATEVTTIQPHFYKNLKSSNYLFFRPVNFCCTHSSDFKLSIAATEYTGIYQSGRQK